MFTELTFKANCSNVKKVFTWFSMPELCLWKWLGNLSLCHHLWTGWTSCQNFSQFSYHKQVSKRSKNWYIWWLCRRGSCDRIYHPFLNIYGISSNVVIFRDHTVTVLFVSCTPGIYHIYYSPYSQSSPEPLLFKQIPVFWGLYVRQRVILVEHLVNHVTNHDHEVIMPSFHFYLFERLTADWIRTTNVLTNIQYYIVNNNTLI